MSLQARESPQVSFIKRFNWIAATMLSVYGSQPPVERESDSPCPRDSIVVVRIGGRTFRLGGCPPEAEARRPRYCPRVSQSGVRRRRSVFEPVQEMSKRLRSTERRCRIAPVRCQTTCKRRDHLATGTIVLDERLRPLR